MYDEDEEERWYVGFDTPCGTRWLLFDALTEEFPDAECFDSKEEAEKAAKEFVDLFSKGATAIAFQYHLYSYEYLKTGRL